jgi:hypothetical protein
MNETFPGCVLHHLSLDLKEERLPELHWWTKGHFTLDVVDSQIRGSEIRRVSRDENQQSLTGQVIRIHDIFDNVAPKFS